MRPESERKTDTENHRHSSLSLESMSTSLSFVESERWEWSLESTWYAHTWPQSLPLCVSLAVCMSVHLPPFHHHDHDDEPSFFLGHAPRYVWGETRHADCALWTPSPREISVAQKKSWSSYNEWMSEANEREMGFWIRKLLMREIPFHHHHEPSSSMLTLNRSIQNLLFWMNGSLGKAILPLLSPHTPKIIIRKQIFRRLLFSPLERFFGKPTVTPTLWTKNTTTIRGWQVCVSGWMS